MIGSALRRPPVRSAAVAGCAALALAACSSSKSSSSTASSSSAAAAGATTTAAPTSPATMFSTSTISGVGDVVVDGLGRTVYVLTSDMKTNLPCDDASGCTKFWPDLPFPDGVSSATAGTGIQQSLLSSKKLADGETYPTYNGWLMYEFVKDSGPGQANGVGVKSFGGTWYALSPSGTLVSKSGASTSTTAASSAGGGSGY
jgi:predicted lipoprotein with Yx(FWY)xxD motif